MDEGLKDHEIMVEEGFYDMQRWPERIPAGTKMRVTAAQYRLMKGSDPNSIQLLSVSPPPDALQRIVEAARAEKAKEVQDWQPEPWYKAQLMKDKDLVLDE